MTLLCSSYLVTLGPVVYSLIDVIDDDTINYSCYTRSFLARHMIKIMYVHYGYWQLALSLGTLTNVLPICKTLEPFDDVLCSEGILLP